MNPTDNYNMKLIKFQILAEVEKRALAVINLEFSRRMLSARNSDIPSLEKYLENMCLAITDKITAAFGGKE